MKDFEPISLLTNEPMVIGSRKEMPAADLKELIAWLKANPGKATAATGGSGDITAMASTQFQNLTGTQFQLVPYRGSSAAFADVINGRIDLIFSQASSLLPLVEAGNVKTYAVLASKRMQAAPNIPTGDEVDCRALIRRTGSGCGRPRVRPRRSSASSMLRLSMLSRITERARN